MSSNKCDNKIFIDMGFRSVKIKFKNVEGDEQIVFFKQHMSEEDTAPNDFTPIPIEPIDDIVINPIDLDFSDLDFSDFDFSGLDFNFGNGALGEMSIGPIFAPGGGTTIQGWNNGNPRNNWGMDPDGDWTRNMKKIDIGGGTIKKG
jgi:hypothetical protein